MCRSYAGFGVGLSDIIDSEASSPLYPPLLLRLPPSLNSRSDQWIPAYIRHDPLSIVTTKGKGRSITQLTPPRCARVYQYRENRRKRSKASIGSIYAKSGCSDGDSSKRRAVSVWDLEFVQVKSNARQILRGASGV